MMTKILFVDDEVDLEPLVLQRFRRQIREGMYAFFFAHNGIEALALLEQHPDVELVISDINMPQMDGLTLLQNIQMKYPNVRSVVVSAYGDMENIRTAMNRGAFDFVTKPVDFGDLDATMGRALEQIALLKSATDAKEKLISVEKEISIAAQLQQSILPQQMPENPSIELSASMIPATDIGGDFYDYFWIDPHHIALVMADVSGKGLTAGLFMAVSSTFIKAYAPFCKTPSECLAQVNAHLIIGNDAGMFVTLFYGVLDIRTGEFVFSNAGHCYPLLRHKGEVIEILSKNGPALGIFDEAVYENGTIQLTPGDDLLLFTDGVTEAMSKDFEEYSVPRLKEGLTHFSSEHPREYLKDLLADIRLFTEGALPSDDITTLALKFKEASHG
jgi:sigma-B regulation protein RsbU (phosphoserine phosphatase)